MTVIPKHIWDNHSLKYIYVGTSDLKLTEFFYHNRVTERIERVEQVTWLDRVYCLWKFKYFSSFKKIQINVIKWIHQL